jgi:hypothetical protein
MAMGHQTDDHICRRNEKAMMRVQAYLWRPGRDRSDSFANFEIGQTDQILARFWHFGRRL